jgi:glucosylceramidase
MITDRFFRHYLTAKASKDRMAEKSPVLLDEDPDVHLPSVSVDPSKRFQTIEGFGGAFTEASAVSLSRMRKEHREQLFKAYFHHTDGHGYSLCRTHMNSCDFSLGNYACTEVDGDVELKHFSIDRDRRALLPMIKEAQKAAGEPLKILVSPWSPPAWMKTNGQFNGGGKLKSEYRQVWANYFVRFIREYEKEGVPIWGVTVQNEPAAAQVWDSCVYSAEEERDFVRDHLGPAFKKAGLEHIKIIIWDHNRDLLIERVQVAYNDPKASPYIWGAAFHWYGPEKFENLQLAHEAWPDKKLIFTEGCQEGGPHLGSWDVGERYGHEIINDLNRWTVGWIDWNLLLDETGGPNHANNLCSAPIIADTVNDRLVFQSSYYYLGHFCRFIRPGAARVLCASTREDLQVTAFRNPDESVAVVVLNRTDEERKFCLKLPDRAGSSATPAHSISTYLWQPS